MAEYKSLAEQIKTDFGIRIIRGELAPGELVVKETDLSQQLGVSRSAVREAFKALAAKGMLKATRRKGTEVMPMSDWNALDPEILHWMESSGYSYAILHELLQIRYAIEPEASAIVALNRERTDFSKMAEALTAMDEPNATVAELRAADIRFHCGILDATRNRYFAQMKPLLKTSLVFCDVFAEAGNFFEGRLRVDAAGHRRIMTAMLDGDANAARLRSRELIDHIDGFVRTLNAPPEL